MRNADRTFQWTEEALELAARSDVATAALRREDRVTDPEAVNLKGEEALLWVLTGSTPPALQQVVEQRKAHLRKIVVGHLPGGSHDGMTRAERARHRYNTDAAYRERVKAATRDRRKCDEFRARDRERKRAARAAAKAARS